MSTVDKQSNEFVQHVAQRYVVDKAIFRLFSLSNDALRNLLFFRWGHSISQCNVCSIILLVCLPVCWLVISIVAIHHSLILLHLLVYCCHAFARRMVCKLAVTTCVFVHVYEWSTVWLILTVGSWLPPHPYQPMNVSLKIDVHGRSIAIIYAEIHNHTRKCTNEMNIYAIVWYIMVVYLLFAASKK